MKLTSRHYLLLVVLVLVVGMISSQAQDPAPADASAQSTPASGNTIITSDELRMDQGAHTAVFSGNVIVTGTNFKMTCQEMTVTFTTDSKVDTITAKGNVVIIQPGRTTHSGQAQYFHDEDKFVLTDSPVINDNGNEVSAPKIIIYRTKQSFYTDGPTKTVIQQGHGIDASSPPPANSNAQ
jgi:lipopolysaccharide transport protein LptA